MFYLFFFSTKFSVSLCRYVAFKFALHFLHYLHFLNTACIIFCLSTSYSLYYFYLACIFFLYSLYCFSKKDTCLLFLPLSVSGTTIVYFLYFYSFSIHFRDHLAIITNVSVGYLVLFYLFPLGLSLFLCLFRLY